MGRYPTYFLLPVVLAKDVWWYKKFSTSLLTIPFIWPWMSTDRRRERGIKVAYLRDADLMGGMDGT